MNAALDGRVGIIPGQALPSLGAVGGIVPGSGLLVGTEERPPPVSDLFPFEGLPSAEFPLERLRSPSSEETEETEAGRPRLVIVPMAPRLVIVPMRT